ncbi:MAG TPA: SRPBCC family protein [Cytophagaceae bacterium]|nr:SRPBCC family protein [Cytophagaceae bacterium]
MSTLHYTKANYSVAINVAKSAQDVFSHLLKDVPKFWPEEMEGECSRLNDEFVFKTGDSHYSKNKIAELVPDKKLVWLVTDSLRKTDGFEWTGTKMIFELMPKGNHTVLKFTYDGVIVENEYERLGKICDFVVKENLYKLIESFSATIEVTESPQHVFNCLTEVSKWWSKDFEGSSKQLNDEFIIHHPNAHFSKQKLVEVIPGKKLVWLVTESTLHWLQHDKHEWTNTKMIFEINTQKDKTILQFTHEGLVPTKECYIRCEQGWAMVIKNCLFDFIHEGKTI